MDIYIFFFGLICFSVGFFVCGFFIARDQMLLRIKEDEMIVKKPQEGLILIAVTPEVARRVVLKKSKDKNHLEARDQI